MRLFVVFYLFLLHRRICRMIDISACVARMRSLEAGMTGYFVGSSLDAGIRVLAARVIQFLVQPSLRALLFPNLPRRQFDPTLLSPNAWNNRHLLSTLSATPTITSIPPLPLLPPRKSLHAPLMSLAPQHSQIFGKNSYGKDAEVAVELLNGVVENGLLRTASLALASLLLRGEPRVKDFGEAFPDFGVLFALKCDVGGISRCAVGFVAVLRGSHCGVIDDGTALLEGALPQ